MDRTDYIQTEDILPGQLSGHPSGDPSQKKRGRRTVRKFSEKVLCPEISLMAVQFCKPGAGYASHPLRKQQIIERFIFSVKRKSIFQTYHD